ncbi:MAG TPA: acylphosphatase [Rectinemataceae bacterium]|nr:acylphosphatase [Rectinemataceae bacterium]
MDPKAAFRAVVTGRVQGVGFRYSARREALRLDLRGWVRNLPDGAVELWVEGDRAAVVEFRAWLDEGPPGAWIREVLVEPRDASGLYPTFSIEF